jgi:threonine synthase
VRFVSTAGAGPPVDLATAVFAGPAPDGGLYLPESLPAADPEVFSDPSLSVAERSARLLAPFLGDLDAGTLTQLLAEALDFPLPLVELEDGIHVLELFHGPTLAFKDVGARTLARLIAALRGDDDREVTVLVATSGDTGGAVAHAFAGVAGTRVAVLYPSGRISPLQEKQIATLGGNVLALAVEGGFDDCQRLVRQVFGDRGLACEMRLTSANSINVGRLLPQMVYYAHAAARLAPARVLFSVPSGNFGNLTAGLMAHRMGMPAAGFVAATNVNDVVPAYLETGVFTPRPSVPTMSSAMDVGDPSNLARIRALYGDDPAAIRRDVTAASFDDDATAGAIHDVAARTGYLLDPHTAVGYLGLRRTLKERGGGGPGILLATAHPAKFLEQVEPILGRPLAVPEPLARCMDRPIRSHQIAAQLGALAGLLRVWPAA